MAIAGKEPPTRKEREYEQRRNEIREVAEAVFAERGFVSTTMEEIARRAEFSVGSLYKFFKNKDDLYVDILTARADEMEPVIYEALENGCGPLEKIRALMTARLELFWKYPRFFRLYFHQTMGTVTDIRAGFTPEILERYEQLLSVIEGIFEEGIKSGQFKGVAPKTLTQIFEGIIRSYLAGLSQQESPQRNKAEEESLFDIFTRGLLERRGSGEQGC